MTLQSFIDQIDKRAFPLEFPGHFVKGTRIKFEKAQVLKESINPSRNEKLIDVRFDRAVVAQAIDAVAAYSAQHRSLPPLDERLGLIRRFRQCFADFRNSMVTINTIEAGKPKWEAEHDVDVSIRFLDDLLERYQAMEEICLGPARLTSPNYRYQLKPSGPVLAFLPFSSPCNSFVQYFSASILAGCPILFVASSHAVLSGLLFSYIAEESQCPMGLLNIVFGNFTIFKEILQDRNFAAVVYKGSREHCDTIRKENINVLDRELFIQSGGKNAVVVTESADVKLAVRIVFEGLVRSAGQLCSSTSRVFVAKDLLTPFTRLLDETLHEMIIGPTDDPSKPVPHMGPLYAQKAIDRFLRFQTMATREAEKTISWGKAVPGSGCFVRPGAHVFKEVDLSSAYQSNVIMSPDLAIYPFKTFQEAILGCNLTDASLVVSVVGGDTSIRERFSDFDAPHIHLDSATTEAEVNLPLSGRKQSGNKRFNSLALAYYLLSPQAIMEETPMILEGFPLHPRLL